MRNYFKIYVAIEFSADDDFME